MRKMGALFLGLLLLALLVYIDSHESGHASPLFSESQSFFPLQIGNEWTYYLVEGGVGDTTADVFYFVFDTVSLDGRRYFAYGEDSNFPEYYRADSLGHVFRYIDGSETIWFDFTKAEGDSYQIDLPSLKIHYRVRVLGRNEVVENRAGRFENCLRLLFDDPNQFDDAFELWFARDVGIVKRFLPHAIVQQLYSAKVNGRTYPATVVSAQSEGDRACPKLSFLLQNYPNPVNANTVIQYFLFADFQDVRLKIYDTYGREVATLVDEMQVQGDHRVCWSGVDNDGIPVASGIYLYKLQVGHFHLVRKLGVLR